MNDLIKKQFLSRRFYRPIYFQFEFIPNLVPHRNLTDQLQSQARTNVALTCRHVHVRPHCFILTEACSCRLELAYFAGNISKNRLVCKNAVALAYYGSCRLLVMGSCPDTVESLHMVTLNTITATFLSWRNDHKTFFKKTLLFWPPC